MSVSRRTEHTVTLIHIHFYTVRICECVCLVRISRTVLVMAFLKMLCNIIIHEIKYFNIFIFCTWNPCEMINFRNFCIYLFSFCLNARKFFKNITQKILCVKHFMTTAKRFNRRKYIIQRLCAYAHWICKINNPCIRTIFFYCCRKLFIKWNCAECSWHTSRTCRITDALVNIIFFRIMDIHSHIFKSSRKNWYYNKIRTT